MSINYGPVEADVEEDHFSYHGKTVSYSCGWDGEYGYVPISELVARAAAEFPGVPLDKVGISISQESNIVMFDLSIQQQR